MKDAARARRRLAAAGALAALAIAVCYLEQIPWLELQSLLVFAAGWLLGVRAGALVGALAMGAYSIANPYGLAHPLVFAAQVGGRALVGAAGGIAGRWGLPESPWMRAAALGAWAIAVSLVYDLVTNAASGVVYGPLLPALVLGAPWALAHAASNAVLFVVAGGPLTSALDARRGAFAALLAAFALASPASPARAQSAAPADTTMTITLDEAVRAAADTARADSAGAPTTLRIEKPPASAPDTLRASLPIDWRRLAVRLESRPFAQAAGLPVLARANASDVRDAFALLGAAPRFYADAPALEPVGLAGAPEWLARMHEDGRAFVPRSTPWVEAERAGDCCRVGNAWSPVALAALPDASRGVTLVGEPPEGPAGSALESGEGGIDLWSLHPTPGGTASGVRIGIGGGGRADQAFRFHAARSLRGVDVEGRWAAWSRRSEPHGALGTTGAHGLDVGLRLQRGSWWLDAAHGAERVSSEDFDVSIEERRGGERTKFALGGSASSARTPRWQAWTEILDDRADSDSPFRESIGRAAREVSAGARADAEISRARVGLEARATRQRVRLDVGTLHDAPGELETWRVTAFASRPLLGGDARLALALDGGGGGTRFRPSASWSGAGPSHTRIFAAAGAIGSPQLAEAGRAASAPDDDVLNPRGAAGQVGLIFGSASADSIPLGDAVIDPGRLPRGAWAGRAAVVGWTLEGIAHPAYGLFARDVLEGESVVGGADGVALVVRADGAPLGWLAAGATGYAAARQLPPSIDIAAPDYRALCWIGPRLRLFSRSLDLLIRFEADIVGPRAARDEEFAAVVRPGARAVLGIGPAWLAISASDLDDARHPLPGRRFDGDRLMSPGRIVRFRAEWRFFD